MPVIVNAKAQHPFLPSLGDLNAIDNERAQHQDIRPLEIAVINLMADKRTTERLLAGWLGHGTLQVNLTFACTDDYVHGIHNGHVSHNTPSDHIKKFYKAFSDIRHLKFDGLIVTGVNALQYAVDDEIFWPDVQEILDWSDTNVFSSLYLCWGAQAGLKHFYNVDSFKQDKKIFGLFDHHIVKDTTGLLAGFPDVFPVPISRWQATNHEQIAAHPELEVVAEVDKENPNILVESKPYDQGKRRYPHRVYVLSHPEYETPTLQQEFERDRLLDPQTPLPENYFPGNDPTQSPRNTWRHTAFLYANWIKAIYESAPYNIGAIPQPFEKEEDQALPLSKAS